MARPAWFADNQLRVMVDVENSTNVTIRLYTGSMFRLGNGSLTSTDSLTVLLGIEQVSLQSLLKFNDKLGQSLNISLNNTYLSSRGLEECGEEPNAYTSISIIIPGVSEAGQYRFDIVARFTSTVNETEKDLRDSNRFFNVTQALRVDLEGQCVCNIAYVYKIIFHSHKHHSYNCQ